MDILAVLGITIFGTLLFCMSVTVGTKPSISALAEQWRWLLLVALWSQVLLLPQMITITVEPWKFLPFIGISGVIICGGASILNKEDELVHMIAAAVTFTAFFAWVMVTNSCCLLATVMCIMAGRQNLKWRAEVGLITSVYLVLILSIYGN